MCNQCNDSNQEHVHALRTRREVLKAGAALVAAPFLGGVTSIVQAAQAAGTGVPVGRPAHARAGQVRGAATDAATGKNRWIYDPETWKNGTPSNNGFVHRGVAYWADGDDQRILFGTGDGYLICLNAQTGKPIPSFGEQGRIDLTQGLGREVDRHLYGVSSPPVICRDVVVMGSKVNDVPLVAELPPGDVRGFDDRAG